MVLVRLSDKREGAEIANAQIFVATLDRDEGEISDPSDVRVFVEFYISGEDDHGPVRLAMTVEQAESIWAVLGPVTKTAKNLVERLT